MSTAIKITVIDENYPGIEKCQDPAYDRWYIFNGNLSITEGGVDVVVPLIVAGDMNLTGSLFAKSFVVVNGNQEIGGNHLFKKDSVVYGNQTVGGWQRGVGYSTVHLNQRIGGYQDIRGLQRCYGNQEVFGTQYVNGDNRVGGFRTIGKMSDVSGRSVVAGRDTVFSEETTFYLRLYLDHRRVVLMENLIMVGGVIKQPQWWAANPVFDPELTACNLTRSKAAESCWNNYGAFIMAAHKYLVELHADK
jgi:hypothetical protein